MSKWLEANCSRRVDVAPDVLPISGTIGWPSSFSFPGHRSKRCSRKSLEEFQRGTLHSHFRLFDEDGENFRLYQWILPLLLPPTGFILSSSQFSHFSLGFFNSDSFHLFYSILKPISDSISHSCQITFSRFLSIAQKKLGRFFLNIFFKFCFL